MQVFVKNFLLRQHELITLRASTFGHVPGRRITSLQSNLWMGGLEKGLIRSQSSFDRNFALISLDWHARTIKTNIEELLFWSYILCPLAYMFLWGFTHKKYRIFCFILGYNEPVVNY